MWSEPTVRMDITDFAEISEAEVWVVRKSTGEELTLPADKITYGPGCVYLPVWMAKKIIIGKWKSNLEWNDERHP